jgi:cytochrome c oxidase cbb3-type subunit III
MKNTSSFGGLLFCLCLGLTLALPALAQDEPALLNVLLRDKSMAQATESVINAVNSNNYTFVRQQAIDSRLVPADWEARSVRIVYFCNFDSMNRALALDTRATEFLPCRITLIETEDGIELIAVNPAWLSLRMGNYRLHEYCVKMKADYLAIMNEAAL